jgi:glycosyltransferase involved in cell wall biosynthesis
VMAVPEPVTGGASRALASIVIPAHDEAAVIERCLDALFAGTRAGELEVIVVCNGCRDETAAVARGSGHPVQVIELTESSKIAALRAGDLATNVFPRLYVDADVVLPGPSARAVALRLAAGALAARPPIFYETASCSHLVRSYYRARARMPAVMRSLWGAGVYGLSAEGRARFDVWPELRADDVWIDRQFERDEVEIVDCDPVTVAVPLRTSDLLRVLPRTYRGKASGAPDSGVDERVSATTASAVADLRRLAASGPRGAIDAAVYASFALGARASVALDRRRGRASAHRWERDNSSRAAA